MKTGSQTSHVHEITVAKPKLPIWVIVAGIILLMLVVIAGVASLAFLRGSLRGFWDAQ